MSQPKEVPAEKLTPCTVYLRGKGQRMLVLEAGENADDAPGGPTCFVSARDLLSWEEEHHHAVSRRSMFKVVADGQGAIRDAGDQLDRLIWKAEADLKGLKPDDPARGEREAQLARDRAQREWLAQAAKQCGVRLRAS